MKFAIIAAGEGSRLSQEGVELPKPLVRLNGEAMIDRLIRIFNENGAEEICIIVNRLHADGSARQSADGKQRRGTYQSGGEDHPELDAQFLRTKPISQRCSLKSLFQKFTLSYFQNFSLCFRYVHISLLHTNIPVVYTVGILVRRYLMKISATQQKILEVGKREFLAKGFKDASLRKIVAEAGYTNGDDKGYYPDKAAIFEAQVSQATDGMIEQFKAAQDAHFDLIPENKTSHSDYQKLPIKKTHM